jgi:RNA polymerase sigma factor (sigma-70 family)
MDAGELSALYRSYAPSLLESLRRRFPWSTDLVEDGVQHAFLALSTCAPPPDEPRAWLRTVARHYIIDGLRADGRLVSDDDALEAHAIDPPPSGSARVSTTLVQRALRQLTTRAQRLLRGKYIDGKTYGALARQEGLAKSGMGRILDRARQRLRGAIEELRRPDH